MNEHHTTGNLGPPQPSPSAGAVLVVDDDADIRQVMVFVLETAGYTVECAVDGVDALKVLGGREFDLVVTDMLMPGGDGLELLAALRKTPRAIKVLVMSGGGIIGVNDYLKVAAKLGADGVLEKPFTGKMLLAAVNGLLKKEG